MRRRIAIPLVVLGVCTLIAAVIGLLVGGAPTTPLLIDPGALVRWGTPIATAISNLAASVTIGTLVFVCFAVPRERPEFERLASLASVSAVVWTLATVVTAVFSFASAASRPIGADAQFSVGLWTFLTDTEAGVARAWVTIFAAVVAMVLMMVRNYWGLAAAAIIAGASFIPLAELEHQGGNADHNTAWNALFLHIAGAAVWVGGLVALWLADRKGRREYAERFSAIALVAFIIVAYSGVASAWIRMSGPQDLLTPYGAILLTKVVAMLLLGVIGAVHRRYTIRRLPGSLAFARLLIAELVLMGIAMGMAAALGDTAPPLGPAAVDTSPAGLLTGAPLPPAPSFQQYFFTIDPDPLWIAICGAMLVLYFAGVVTLTRRGDRWSPLRTGSWMLGVLALAWATSGGIAAYTEELFSAHMLMHMVVGMMIPVLLVPGAPVTLALRSFKARHDGSRGPREWIMELVHSRWLRIVGNPYVAAVVFVAGLWVFYYTPVFSWASTTHIGHEWMIIHFLIAGYLFVQVLIGIDPVPGRPPHAVRLLLLLVTMAGHAFFGLAIMTGTGLMLADWFGAMGWDTGVTALQDQQSAGGIAWGVGEFPTIVLAVAVAVQWSRSDDREARRRDRAADRDGDAELNAYNAELAKLASRDEA